MESYKMAILAITRITDDGHTDTIFQPVRADNGAYKTYMEINPEWEFICYWTPGENKIYKRADSEWLKNRQEDLTSLANWYDDLKKDKIRMMN